MKAGKIVDVLDMEMLKRGEIHSYTRELIAASPDNRLGKQGERGCKAKDVSGAAGHKVTASIS